MIENEPTVSQSDAMRSRVTCLRVSALIRNEDAALRSAIAGRDLVRLVAELDPSTVVALTMTSGPRRGRVSIECELHDAPSTLARELATVLASVAVLSRITARGSDRAVQPVSPLTDALELRRARIAPLFDEREEMQDADYRPIFAPIAPRRIQPLALPNTADSLAQLLAVLAENPGLIVRSLLSASTDIERMIVADELHAPAPGADLTTYQGVVVRARTVIAATRGTVSALMRARVRQWANSVTLEPVTLAEAESLWSEPAEALVGRAMPDGAAMSLVRFPAAGENSVVGMPTRRPELRKRALDPLPPRATNPIRLGVAFGADGRRISAELDIDDVRRHLFIEGKSGAGKTSLILALYRELTRAGYAVTYLDPHGDGARAASAFASEDGAPSTYVVRHGDTDHPVRLDIVNEADPELRAQSVSEFLELLQGMFDPRQEGIVGPRFLRWFTLITDAVHVCFGERGSLSTVAAVASDLARVRALAQAIAPLDPDLAHRLKAEVGDLRGDDAASMTSWAMSKFQPFLASSAMRDIIGTGADSLDVGELFESGSSLIVDLAMPRLGVQSARVLGALWLLKHWVAMGRHGAVDRPRVILVDEAHLFTFGVLPALLAEGRKFGIGVVIATQNAAALSPKLLDAVEANCSSMVNLRTGVRGVAAASARLGGFSASELLRLPDLTAGAVLSRDGVATEPFTLQVDHHVQVRRAGWNDVLIEQSARAAAAGSRELLWRPHSAARVLTDREVVEIIDKKSSRQAAREVFPRPRRDHLRPQAASSDEPSREPSRGRADASDLTFADWWKASDDDPASPVQAGTPS